MRNYKIYAVHNNSLGNQPLFVCNVTAKNKNDAVTKAILNEYVWCSYKLDPLPFAVTCEENN